MIRRARLSALAIGLAASLVIMPWPARVLDVAQAMQDELAPDVYEPDDTAEQAHPLLTVGIPQPRTFHTPEDVDWAYLTLDAGERVGVSTTGPCDTFLTLYAPDARTPIAQDDDSGGDGNALIRFSAPIDGAYYVQVRQFGRATRACGPYQLVANVLPPPAADANEPDNSSGQAKPLPTDGSAQPHTIHVSDDQDWVSLAIQANTALRIGTQGDCDTVLTLFGPDGRTQLAEDDDSGSNGNAVIVYTFTAAGTYFARIRLFDELDLCDSYTVSATVVPPSFPDAFEPDNTPEQARPLPLTGAPQERSFHRADDLDWVSFFLSAGDRVLIWTSGSCDTYLFIVSSDGRTVLAEDDDSGEEANAAAFFAAKQSGMYYAVVRPFGGTSPTCASYQLQGLLLPPTRPGAAGTPGPGGPAGMGATPTATPRPAIVPTPPRRFP
jgi:Bacterial pre-peptidase C-terminal domain